MNEKMSFFCSVFWGPVLNWLFFFLLGVVDGTFKKKAPLASLLGAHGAQMAHRSRASTVGGVTTTYVVKNVCC